MKNLAGTLLIPLLLLVGCSSPPPSDDPLGDACQALYDGPLLPVQNIVLRLMDEPTGTTITQEEVARVISDLTLIAERSPAHLRNLIQPQVATMEDILELLESGENRIIELVELRESSIDIVAICDPIIDAANNPTA